MEEHGRNTGRARGDRLGRIVDTDGNPPFRQVACDAGPCNARSGNRDAARHLFPLQPFPGVNPRQALALARPLVDPPHFETGCLKGPAHAPCSGKGGHRRAPGCQLRRQPQQIFPPHFRVPGRCKAIQEPGIEWLALTGDQVRKPDCRIAPIEGQPDSALRQHPAVPSGQHGGIDALEFPVYGKSRPPLCRNRTEIRRIDGTRVEADIVQPATLAERQRRGDRKVEPRPEAQFADTQRRAVRSRPARHRGQV